MISSFKVLLFRTASTVSPDDEPPIGKLIGREERMDERPLLFPPRGIRVV